MKKLKIGLDIHGVIDTYPEVFAGISEALIAAGHEVHIITGPYDSPELRKQLYDLGIRFTHFFSMAGHHRDIGTEMRHDERGRPWLDDELWNRTKGEYCEREGIDIHFDDSDDYWKHFKTPYMLMK